MPSLNPSYENPILEVLSASPRREFLQERLRLAGFRPVTANMPIDHFSTGPLLVDIATAKTTDDLERFAELWSRIGRGRLLILLGELPESLANINCVHLLDVDQIETLPARLSIKERHIRQAREFRMRQDTAVRMGASFDDPVSNSTPSNLLYLGQGAAIFTPLRAALHKAGTHVTATFGSGMTQDAIASQKFCGLILHTEAPEDAAQKFLASFTTATAPSGFKIVLMETKSNRRFLSQEIAQKADGIVDIDGNMDMAVKMIREICMPAPYILEAEDANHSIVRDKSSGLFSREFLNQHLNVQMQVATDTATSLSVVALNLKAQGSELRAIASKILPQLRDEDLAARFDHSHILITMPATNYRGAVSFAKRIEELVPEVQSWRAIERRQFHTVKTLIGGLTARSSFNRLRRA